LSTSPDILEGLLRSSSGDDAIDRKALAGLLIEIAQSPKPELRAQQNGVRPGDLQLEQLRTLLVGHEIETLSRLTGVVDDPERLAAAIGRVLPTAIAQATSDTRMGHVLAPIMEKAAESSIRSDPSTLVNILYPMIVPAIRKSIGETIDETFQRLNQTLKFSLTWRGLKWRWEAWRMRADGSQARQLTRDGATHPRSFGDDPNVYFSKPRQPGLFRVHPDGGEEMRVSSESTHYTEGAYTIANGELVTFASTRTAGTVEVRAQRLPVDASLPEPPRVVATLRREGASPVPAVATFDASGRRVVATMLTTEGSDIFVSALGPRPP